MDSYDDSKTIKNWIFAKVKDFKVIIALLNLNKYNIN